MIRVIQPSDLEEVRRIHELYFSDQFDLPDFSSYVGSFIVEDDKGILVAGGVRDVAELTVVTNKGRSTRDRTKALYQLLDASLFITQKLEYSQLRCYTSDPRWVKILEKHSGFRLTSRNELVINL